MKDKILNMIKQGWYSLVSKDADPYPLGQATVNERATKFVRASVYGICSNPPDGSHILLLSAQGQESTKFGFINDYINRKKDLKEGEIALFNTLTNNIIFLKEDGTTEIESYDADKKLVSLVHLKNDASILIKNQEANGDPLASIELKPDGTIQIDAKGNLIQNITGDVTQTIDGNVEIEATKFSFGNGTDEFLTIVLDGLTEYKKLVGATLLAGSVDAPGAGSTGTNSLILSGLASMETAIGNLITALGNIKV